jgi:transcriptional regulator with XRE-family HTH domain
MEKFRNEGLHIYIGRNMRKLRKRLGISQEELAALSGLHRTYIGGIERGERNITVKTLQIIANALKVSPEVLLSKEESGDV